MSTPSNSLPAPHLPRSRFSTPHSTRRLPVTTEAVFNRQHRQADDQLRHYHERGRKGSVHLNRDALTELDRSQAMYLYANNLDARLNFARITSGHLAERAKGLGADQPVFFVTLIRHDHTIREDHAAGFKIKRLHSWVHEVLRGCAYVGMVECSLFTNLNAAGASFKRGVSWHVHAVVWGVTEAELSRRIDAVNTRYRSIVEGIKAAHYRRIGHTEVAGKSRYMCKGQLSEYRAWPRKDTIIDNETGEITIEGTGRFRQGKRPLRPCDMVRMCNIFAGMTLDKLAFAGGAGKTVLKDIRQEALSDFYAHEHRRKAHQALRYPIAPQNWRAQSKSPR